MTNYEILSKASIKTSVFVYRNIVFATYSVIFQNKAKKASKYVEKMNNTIEKMAKQLVLVEKRLLHPNTSSGGSTQKTRICLPPATMTE